MKRRKRTENIPGRHRRCPEFLFFVKNCYFEIKGLINQFEVRNGPGKSFSDVFPGFVLKKNRKAMETLAADRDFGERLAIRDFYGIGRNSMI